MIAVEAAAGAVFLPIIKLQSWVRRDGLSLDFLRSSDFPNNVLLHRARGVFVEFFTCYRTFVISMGEGGANTSCPGRLRS